MAHIAGLVAADVHPSPVPYCEIVTTTTHKTLRGARGGMILCRDEFAKKVNSRVFPGMQGGPLMHAVAGKAVAFGEALQPDFKEYARQDRRERPRARRRAAGGRPEPGLRRHGQPPGAGRPAGNADVNGHELEEPLESVGVTCNKNMVPNDPEKPTVTSGVRLGTPAMTTRGMGEDEMREIAEIICAASRGETDGLRDRVSALTDAFPLYE